MSIYKTTLILMIKKRPLIFPSLNSKVAMGYSMFYFWGPTENQGDKKNLEKCVVPSIFMKF